MTTLMHWGVTLLCFGLPCWWYAGRPAALGLDDIAPLTWGMFAFQGVVAGVTTALAWRAYRNRHSYFQTDHWDRPAPGAKWRGPWSGTFVLHGTASPTWFVVGVALIYAATLMVGISGVLLMGAVTVGRCCLCLPQRPVDARAAAHDACGSPGAPARLLHPAHGGPTHVRGFGGEHVAAGGPRGTCS